MTSQTPIQAHFQKSLTAGLAAILLTIVSPSALNAQTAWERLIVRSPTPTPNHLRSASYGGGKFLAVGDGGAIVSSDDGTTWESHNAGYTRSLKNIVFGNGIFLVTGADNRYILTSPDLETWSVERPADVPFNPNGLMFHNGMFYICGSEGRISKSVDGITWTSSQTGNDERLQDIAFGGGQFICVGDDSTVYTSPDAETWTIRPTGIELEGLNSGLLSVHYLNGMFVVGGKEGTLLTSPDGITWTHRPFNDGNDWFYDIEYIEGAYYLPGRQGTLQKTTDFATFEQVQTTSTDDIFDLVHESGLSLVIGREGHLSTSPDLSEWTPRQGGFDESFNRVLFQDGAFFAADYNGVIRTSTDGVTWNALHTIDVGVNDMIYADGKFVTVNSASEISQSLDGTIWSLPERQFEGFGINAIRYVNERWFLLGRGLIQSSTNLSSWTGTNPETDASFYDIEYANGIYVAVASSGNIFTSTDGEQWTKRESETTRHIYAIAFGGGKFVATGQFSMPLFSLDGITWSAEGVGFAPSNIFDLDYRNGQFVGVASGGRVGISSDALEWQSISTVVSTNLRSFAEGNDRLVVVGNRGLIMSTEPLPDHTLTVETIGDGSVTSNPAGTTFPLGTPITLTATPSLDSAFVRWEGDASGNENPLTITLDGNKSITAVFQVALTGYDLWRATQFNAG